MLDDEEGLKVRIEELDFPAVEGGAGTDEDTPSGACGGAHKVKNDVGCGEVMDAERM